jgi:acetyl esterase/lipase
MGTVKILAAMMPLAIALAQSPAQRKPELLWPEGAPGAVANEDADRPSLTTYLPPAARNTGAGVVVCPGGGYHALAMDHEGDQIARWLNSFGVAGFVLKYRLGPRYRYPAQLQDAQRALRLVRRRAQEFHLRPDRIGIWGFSAGGHLAATAGTHFDSGEPDSRDPIQRMSSRPDFLILAYPVISFVTPYTHRGSLGNLLGESPDPKLVESLSAETQVTAQTPPTFLFHTNEDRGVPAENSVLFYLALRKVGVPAEMHIYERGPHGVGLAALDQVLSSWPDRLAGWFQTRGLLSGASNP